MSSASFDVSDSNHNLDNFKHLGKPKVLAKRRQKSRKSTMDSLCALDNLHYRVFYGRNKSAHEVVCKALTALEKGSEPGLRESFRKSLFQASLRLLRCLKRRAKPSGSFERSFLLAWGPERVSAVAKSPGVFGTPDWDLLLAEMQNSLGFPLLDDGPVSSSLHQCARLGYHDVLQKLLTQCSGEGQLQDGRLNAPDTSGHTCLDYAALLQDTSILALLAKFGATKFNRTQSPSAEIKTTVTWNSQKLPAAKRRLITQLCSQEATLPKDLSRLIFSFHSSADLLQAGGHL